MSEMRNEDTSTMHEKLRVAVRCEEIPEGVPVKFAACKYKSHAIKAYQKWVKYKLYVRHGKLCLNKRGRLYIIVPPQVYTEKGMNLSCCVRVHANGQSVYSLHEMGTSKHIYQWWFADEKTPKLPRVVIK